MLKIRLQRHGAKHAPFYRMVVTEVTAPRDGRFIEILGTYDPQCHAKEDELKLKMNRIDHWLGVGAQPTDTVRSLIRQGRLDPEERLARAEKKSQSKVARRLKGAASVPSMDDSTGDAPAEDSSPTADQATEAPAEEPVATEAVVSEASSEASAPDDDADSETTQSDDSEQLATDEDTATEDSSGDSSVEEVAEELVSEDAPKAEPADAPAEDNAADSSKDASAEDETTAEEETDGGGEEEKPKD
jgi:small subunit ribosomal protein S16